jgi:SAM-dependent methyltransferase
MQNAPTMDIDCSALSARKRAVRNLADQYATRRDAFIDKNKGFHAEDYRYLRFLIPEGATVLDAGCGTGRLLAALKPSRGVGVDLSPKMVEVARHAHPDLEFIVGDIESPGMMKQIDGKFDIILLHDTIGSLEDCQAYILANQFKDSFFTIREV